MTARTFTFTWLSAVALTSLATPSFGMCRWLGDDLSKNNPPAMNVNLPAGVQNSFVRVLLNYGNSLAQPVTSIFSSGIVIGVQQDQDSEKKPLNTGWLAVLTCDHSIALP